MSKRRASGTQVGRGSSMGGSREGLHHVTRESHKVTGDSVSWAKSPDRASQRSTTSNCRPTSAAAKADPFPLQCSSVAPLLRETARYCLKSTDTNLEEELRVYYCRAGTQG